ncbi:hypothetical protein [Actinospica robiniae]|uniref:hypothetical protein n=1 Tax=Actinospica robiniae TaxID=304901 RepID=UPI00041D61E4|nr:hypothetical protein [Actinospica robiniae]
MSPIPGAQDLVLSVISHVHGRYLKLADWAARYAQPSESTQDEAGNYSTEMVVIIAGIVLLAIGVLAVITKKVLDKANSIDF